MCSYNVIPKSNTIILGSRLYLWNSIAVVIRRRLNLQDGDDLFRQPHSWKAGASKCFTSAIKVFFLEPQNLLGSQQRKVAVKRPKYSLLLLCSAADDGSLREKLQSCTFLKKKDKISRKPTALNQYQLLTRLFKYALHDNSQKNRQLGLRSWRYRIFRSRPLAVLAIQKVWVKQVICVRITQK